MKWKSVSEALVCLDVTRLSAQDDLIEAFIVLCEVVFSHLCGRAAKTVTQKVSRYSASLSTFEQGVSGTEGIEVNRMSQLAWCAVKRSDSQPATL
jgi:hypothetical protein